MLPIFQLINLSKSTKLTTLAALSHTFISGSKDDTVYSF